MNGNDSFRFDFEKDIQELTPEEAHAVWRRGRTRVTRTPEELRAQARERARRHYHSGRYRRSPSSHSGKGSKHDRRPPVHITTTCVNCDTTFVATRYPYLYCSEVCRQIGKHVRWARRHVSDGTIDRSDIRIALANRIGTVLSGGYPERERRVPPAIRALVFARAGGRCEYCHQNGTLLTIQHTRGSSNALEDLQAFCHECNTMDAFLKLRPTTDPAKVELARSIRECYCAERPTRLLDDPDIWPITWRQLARRRLLGQE